MSHEFRNLRREEAFVKPTEVVCCLCHPSKHLQIMEQKDIKHEYACLHCWNFKCTIYNQSSHYCTFHTLNSLNVLHFHCFAQLNHAFTLFSLLSDKMLIVMWLNKNTAFEINNTVWIGFSILALCRFTQLNDLDEYTYIFICTGGFSNERIRSSDKDLA